MQEPDWALIKAINPPPNLLSAHLLQADFSTTSDSAQLLRVIRQFQTLFAPPASAVGCPNCGKKFKTAEHLVQHINRRHAAVQPSADQSCLLTLSRELAETRDFLASEIRAAVKAALEAQTAVPVGVSFADGEFEISPTPSPELIN